MYKYLILCSKYLAQISGMAYLAHNLECFQISGYNNRPSS